VRYSVAGELGDTTYVLAEKPGAAPALLPADLRTRPRIDLPVFAILVVAFAYLAGIGGRGFWGENEAYYSLGARSVLQGHVLLPHWYEGTPVDKPPFAFWWVAMVSAVLGNVTELTARVANLIPALGTLAVVAALGRRWSDGRAGVLGALLLATSYEFWENALEVNTDMLLLFCLTGSWAAMLSLFEAGPRRGVWRGRAWWTMWGLMAVGTLTKGPVVPVLSAIVAIAYACSSYGARGGWRRLWSLRPFAGAAVCLGPTLLWAALVFREHGPEPLRVIFLQHNIERFTNAFDHLRPWYYYILELPISYLPWSLALPFMVAHTVRRMRAGEHLSPLGRFSWVAIATVFVFFSASSSKRDYYILPLMPWLTLLTAGTLWSWATAPAASAARAQWVARTLVALLLAMAGFSLVGRPLLDQRKSVRTMAREIDETVGEGERLVLFDQQDPRLFYYLTSKFEVVDDSRIADLSAMMGDGTELDIVARENEIDNLLAKDAAHLYLERVTRHKDRPYLVVTTKYSPELPELVSSRVRKPSGVAWHPARRTLFIASELGEIAEVTLDGRRVHSRAVEVGALEAVTVGNDGRIYAASEHDPQIYVFDAETLRQEARYAVETGKGEIEGICPLPGEGSFAVAVEGDECVLVETKIDAEAGTMRSVSRATLSTDDVEGLQAGPDGGILVLSREADRMLFVDADGRPVSDPIDLPGFEQEGIAIAEDRIVICEKTGWLAIWPLERIMAKREAAAGN